jgi:hypothetical protein
MFESCKSVRNCKSERHECNYAALHGSIDLSHREGHPTSIRKRDSEHHNVGEGKWWGDGEVIR